MMCDFVNLQSQHVIPTNDFQHQFHQGIHIDANRISFAWIDYVCPYELLMYHQIIVKMLLLRVLE